MSQPPVVAQVHSFPLGQVKLLDSPWLKARDKEQGYLLKLEPERLLHNFRKNAGLEPKGKIYGGWENAGLAGHSLGHYLTACAQAFASSGDKRFKDMIEAIVTGLAECQAHRPDGCISAIPNGDKAWDQIRSGQIKSGGFDLNGLWSPFYTHHKVLQGLLDAHRLAGDKAALGVAAKFADWMVDLTKALSDEQWQHMLGCEYGGINESLAELSTVTGQPKYLALAKMFFDHRNLDPIIAGHDRLAGTHSNTQVPKILGLARMSETTDGGDYRKAVKFFYDTVVNDHTYVIGGNSDHEYFTPAGRLSEELTTNTAETCCTYNMLKLARQLFEWEPDVKYLDFYERAHINQILASQNPETGGVTYFFPLVTGANKNYSNDYDDFTCCHGTGMENHTKHQDSVYFHSGSTLYVAQYQPTELDWKETGLRLRQETDFPVSGKVKFTVLSGSKSELTVKLRHPSWATGPLVVSVNGKKSTASSKPGSFLSLKRSWKKGDVVSLDLPMAIRTEPISGDPNKLAILYGPTVLAADLGAPGGPEKISPVLVPEGRPLGACVEMTGPLEFRIKDAAKPEPLTLKPLFHIVDNTYAVYFDVFSHEEWANKETSFRAEEARLRDLESRTIDLMRIGEMQPERDHNLISDKCDAREANGKGFRTPFAKGFFEFDLKIDADKANQLVVTYWVNNRWPRAGKLAVDGQEIAEFDRLNPMPNNTFQDVTYPLPAALTKGKKHVRIRFSGSDDKQGASVSRVRSVRP
ncbi:MAG: glycoside hydrolase family 127 protein [Armatimonadetes bacterium]|nr:glycoside hydrolase family 127 protein [Armatimonadota bacterium]